MFEMKAEIRIGTAPEVLIRQCHEVTVFSSMDRLDDTALVKIPAKFQNGARAVDILQYAKQGQPISIRLGYIQGEVETTFDEFSGFIKRVLPGNPITIECEDAVYLLRRKDIKMSWKSTTLKEVLSFIVAGTGISLNNLNPEVNIDLKPFRINSNAAEAVQKLKDTYGLVAYFRGNVLFVGLRYQELKPRVVYDFTVNVPQGGNSLKWRSSEDVKLQVVMKGVQKDNTIVEVKAGKEGGEVRTLFRYNITDPKKLKTLADEELKKFAFDGYEGTVTGFLIPFTTHGMVAVVRDPFFPERDGSYFIDAVKTTWGPSGARRVNELGRKAG